jgi:hypothetical protein
VTARLKVIGWKAARPFGWYVHVETHGKITALHWHLLTGNRYRQVCRSDDAATRQWKVEQAAFLQRTGKVVMTFDDFDSNPWKRLAYCGLFQAHNAKIDDFVLTFILGEQLADLYRPSEQS